MGNVDALVFFVFDFLYLDGEAFNAFNAVPLRQRKERLRGLLSDTRPAIQSAIIKSDVDRRSMPKPAHWAWRECLKAG
jgi:ATP-dependent DNA ligase